MIKAWFAVAVIALVLLAVMGRYEIVPAKLDMGTTDTGAYSVVKLDRWTGQTTIMTSIYRNGAGELSNIFYWTKPLRD